MKAVVVGETLSWEEVQTPNPGPNDVLIQVRATAINRADLMQRRGFYPPPPGASEVMGLECAGDVVACGDEVTRWQIGDRVCALLPGGGYAEQTIADEGSVVPIPQGLSYSEAASLPEVFATAWLNLFMEAGLREGERVVLHAGASGVGTAGIQLCRAFGSPCFVTAGTDDKISYCRELGAESGSNRHTGSFVENASDFAEGKGIDVILDPVGGSYMADNLSLLALGGRLVLIGLMGGNRTEVDLGLVMQKRARIIGSTLRARPLVEKAAVMSELEQFVWPKVESGEIRPVIDSEFPVQDAEAAHARIASDETIGKVVLTIG